MRQRYLLNWFSVQKSGAQVGAGFFELEHLLANLTKSKSKQVALALVGTCSVVTDQRPKALVIFSKGLKTVWNSVQRANDMLAVFITLPVGAAEFWYKASNYFAAAWP
jgi:hypothetical protein